MAATLFLLPTIDSHHHLTFHSKPSLKSKLQSFSLSPPKRSIFSNFNFPFTCFSASPSPDHTPSPSVAYNTQNPSRIGCFLTNEELQKLQFLENFTYSCKLPSGYLTIRVLKDIELDITVELLAESFAESMFLPNINNMYLNLLGFLIKQYLIERRGLMPHCATLIGFFRGEREDGNVEEMEEELAGTVEVSFDKRGANASPPTPTPPKSCPYICNMSVKEQLRRKGIGWHLLKASEELISSMSSSRNVYLHCRMIDIAPFSIIRRPDMLLLRQTVS